MTGPHRAVAVVERSGRILVIRRHRGPEVYAVLPGGAVDPGETAEQAVLRELHEECGFDGHIERLLLSGDHGGRRATYFHVTGTEGEPVLGGLEAMLHSERNRYEHAWVRPSELSALPLRPAGLIGPLVEALWPTSLNEVKLPTEWEVVERLWQLHRHDLSDVVEARPDADGLFRSERVATYRDQPDHWGYLVERDRRPVGFAMVRSDGGGGHVLGEFFIVRAMRRVGLARRVVAELLDSRPGPWTVAFQAANTPAATLWRKVAERHFEPGWTEELRPVPGKPEIPHDVWLSGVVRGRNG